MPFPINPVHRLLLESGNSVVRRTSQDVGNSSATSSVAATYPGATIAGNLLWATVYTNTGNAPAISGWTGTTQGINSNTAFMGVFYKIADGTETSITATSTSATIMKIHLYEYTGASNPVTFDVALTGNGTTTGGTSWATSSITTTSGADLILAAVGLNGDSTTPAWSGLNLRQSDARLIDGDLMPGIIKTSFAPTATWAGTLKASAIIGAITASPTSSYLLLEDGTSKLILDEAVALDDPLDTATVSSTTPPLDFVGTTAPITTSFAATSSWVCPTGVNSVSVEVWGGGGGGGGADETGALGSGSGGGGGGYSKKIISVTPGTSYTVTVGSAGTAGVGSTGTDGGTGGDSWFSTSGTILAKGGGGGNNSLTGVTAGAGGAAGSGIGDVTVSGGAGGIGRATEPSTGGGGGGAAGSGQTGQAGATSLLGGAGGTGGLNGGGTGGSGGALTSTNGNAGITPGGGGGGGGSDAATNRDGGAGAAGSVSITYQPPETYEVQVDTVNTFDSTASSVVDSYNESNTSSNWQIDSNVSGINKQGIAQSFTGNGLTVSSVRLYLSKVGTPTGNAIIKIYAHSGVFGTSSIPTGLPLATSSSFDVSTLTTSDALYSIPITPIALSNAVNYLVSFEYSGGDLSNYVKGNVDNTSPTHSGNTATLVGSTWTPQSGNDMPFYIDSPASPLLDKTSDLATGFVDDTTTALGDDRLLLEDGTSYLLLEDNSSKLAINYGYPSGDYVTYTPPSGVLANGSYFWRARNKLTNGSYGAWSEIRSFTVLSGVVLTKTQPSIARIAENLTKTQSAIGRIAVNKTKTQTAVARIANIITKTQSAISRIANNKTSTQPATARIARILTNAQPAVARIVFVLSKTQSAISRISQSFTKTQSAISRIANSLSKTQSATAHIDGTVSKTQSSVARIANIVSKTQSALSSITIENYSYASLNSLPADDSDLANRFIATDDVAVGSDDATFFTLSGTKIFNVVQFKYQNPNSNSTDQISLTVKSKSDEATTTRTAFLQIYNYNSAAWETLTSNSTTAANTQFTLSATQSASPAHYYTTGNWVAVRVYQ